MLPDEYRPCQGKVRGWKLLKRKKIAKRWEGGQVPTLKNRGVGALPHGKVVGPAWPVALQSPHGELAPTY
jgi:hypothetical protein